MSMAPLGAGLTHPVSNTGRMTQFSSRRTTVECVVSLIDAGGKTEKFKEKVEFYDENKKVTHVGLEGDVFKWYKTFNGIWQAVPKAGGKGAIVKAIIEYEKLNQSVPPPHNYMEIMVRFTKDIDAHLSKA